MPDAMTICRSLAMGGVWQCLVSGVRHAADMRHFPECELVMCQDSHDGVRLLFTCYGKGYCSSPMLRSSLISASGDSRAGSCGSTWTTI